MTSDGEKGSGPRKKASASHRPGPTIDLTAREVASEPPADAPAAPEQATSETPAPEPEKAPDPQAGAEGEAEAAAPEADAGEAPPQEPERRSRSGWNRVPGGLPVALLAMTVVAGIVFFLLGLAAANLIAQREVAAVDRTQADNEISERLSKIETTIETVLAAPPAPTAALAPDPALIERITAVEAAAQQVTEQATGNAAAQQRRAEELAALAREAQNRAAAAMQAAESAQKMSASYSSEVSRADIEALNTRIAGLEQTLKTSEAELARRIGAATELDRKSRLVVVSSVLLNAVERSAPFAAELAAAKTLAPDMTASLAPLNDFAAAGLPATPALARELSALIPDLVTAERAQADKAQTAQDAPPAESFLQKLQSNAERLVRIRPVGEVAGDQPVQVIARIEARAARGDVSGAAAELAALPPSVRAPAEAWIRKVGTRDKALALARQFSTNALAALGKPTP